MKRYLTHTSAGLLIVASAALHAAIGNPPPVSTRSERTSSASLPTAPAENSFFNQLPVLSTNGIQSTKFRVSAREAGQSSPEIYGVVVNASAQTSYGLKRIPTSEGEDFISVAGSASTYSNVTSGTESDGIIYFNNLVSRYGTLYCSYYGAFDMDSGQMLARSQSPEMIYSARDMATDPLTGDMYGCFIKTNAGASYVLARVEYEYSNGQFTGFKRDAICDLDNLLTALFFTADGQLWGIDLITDKDENNKEYTKSATLYKIDKQTGAMTEVGETGAKPYYVSSACCDVYNTGTVYWSVKDIDNVGSLYTVDTTTGAATKLFDFPKNEEVVGMFVKSRPGANAPATPANAAMNFPEGGLSGTVTFDIPAELQGGEAANGEVDWKVFCAGAELGSGKGEYGKPAVCNLTISTPGYYQFDIRLYNEGGKSSKASVTGYIGSGVPETPDPTAKLADGLIKVEWDAITKAAYDRGYVNAEAMTYTVTRYPDKTVVCEGTSETNYTENIPADASFGYYSYGVTANDGRATSPEGKSGNVVFGVINLPYLEPFDDTSLISVVDNLSKGVYPVFDLDGSTLGTWYVHSGDMAATCSTGFGDENSWLITPAIRLEAGKSYTLSFDAWTSFVSDNKHSELKIMLGNAQNPDGMTEVIMPVTEILDLKANKGFKAMDFNVASDGVYYFGIQCCTKNGGAQVFIDNLQIEETPEAGIPGPVAEVKLTAPAGSLNATLSGKAPVIDNRGLSMTDAMTIEAISNGEVIATQNNIVPGAKVSFNVSGTKGGEASFGMRARNQNGTGRTVSASCYLGFYAPREPANVKITRNDSGKSFTIKWDAPTQDIKWNTLSSSDLTYKILGAAQDGSTAVLVDNIPGNTLQTTFTDPSVDFNGTQKFVNYGVVAVSNGGMSSVSISNVLPVGAAYPTPYKDSFSAEPTGIYNSNMGSPMGEWYNLDDAMMAHNNVTSQDGDNGYIGYFASTWGTQGALQTGIIDLAGLERPGVTFYMYNIYQNNAFDDNEIFVAFNLGGDQYYITKAEPDNVGNYGKANAWCKYTASLEQVKGQKVSLLIVPTTRGYVWNFIDNLKVDNLPEVDLSAGPSAGSSLIEDGQSGLYIFNIINNGYKKADSYNFDLLRNGKSVNSYQLRNLEAGSFRQIQITDTPDVDADETSEYKGVVTAQGDPDLSDNDSDPIITRIVLPPYPTVDGLQSQVEESGEVSLTWNAPDLDYVPNPMTETFERGNAWDCGYTGWEFIDVDQAPVNLGSANGAFGDKIVTGSKQSFFMMDITALDEQRRTSTAFAAHSGTKYLMKCAPSDAYTSGDDWAITPELYGDAQTVTLWAHSHSSTAPENIEGLYSTGSLDPADFVSVGKYIDVPTGWTQYSFELPQGAKRFAIRCHSKGTFFIQVDDVTYQPMPLDLELKGYHLWRNGKRITTEPLVNSSYIDKDAKAGDSYRVTALYHLGESVPSETHTPTFSGVSEIGGDDIIVRTGKGMIFVTGASDKNIEIFSADGRMVMSEKGLFSNSIVIEPGVYLVRISNFTTKVIVK
ncbi:MAG: choice-of-anchor J domain-containing protein [Muribaculaceae bacterium]|nr:choice-of-anchor J domain-containing protein [Muribaculaceae bacterium]